MLFKKSYVGKGGNEKKASRWSLRFKDHLDVRRCIALTSDKAASAAIERTISQLVDIRKAGERPVGELAAQLERMEPRIIERLTKLDIIRASQAGAMQPLEKLLDRFIGTMRARERAPEYISDTRAEIVDMLQGTKARFILDLTTDKAERHLRDRRERDGIGARRYNALLSSMRRFIRWMKRESILLEDPTSRIATLPIATDRRLVHRVLTDAEIEQMLASLTGTHHKLNAWQRRLIYLFGLKVGTRHKEARLLERRDLSLDGDKPTITFRPEIVKNKRGCTLPLHPGLAEEMRQYFREHPLLPGAVIFPTPEGRGAEMARKDLETAGLEYETPAGFATYHAMRHTSAQTLRRAAFTLPWRWF